MLSMDDLRYTADLPYPPIKVEMKNPAYAKAMLDNICLLYTSRCV